MGDDKKKAAPKRKTVKKAAKRKAPANKADKTKLYGESMEMLGEDLVASNAELGGEAKNDELGQAAAEAMRALLKNKKAGSKKLVRSRLGRLGSRGLHRRWRRGGR